MNLPADDIYRLRKFPVQNLPFVFVQRFGEALRRIEAVWEAAVKKAQASLDAWHDKHPRDNRGQGDLSPQRYHDGHHASDKQTACLTLEP